ncbi:MAG: hypothetical protein JXQ84_04320 [Rhodospirillaceae bacterium]|nr:hypothetical protein [Rhodospirillaceae bacterium]
MSVAHDTPNTGLIMSLLSNLRLFPFTLACGLVLAGMSAAQAEGGGGKSKTAFGPGEHTLQLAPMWIPVTSVKPKKTGASAYRPITLILTSQDHGMMAMCYKLPYLTEAFLFTMNHAPTPQNHDGRLNLDGIHTRLLNAATQITGPNIIKSVEIIDGTPRPTPNNQDILALCQ